MDVLRHFRSTRRFLAMVPLAVVCMLIVSACSSPLSNFGMFSTYQLLAQSVIAMRQVTSTHIALQVSGSTHLSQAVLPGIPQDEQIMITGTGDEALPRMGQEQLQLAVKTTTGSPLQVNEVYSQRHLFVQSGAQGTWFEVDTNSLPRVQSLIQSLIPQNLDLGTLLTLAQHVQVSDKGSETIAGQALHHVSVAFDTAGLQQLLAASHPATQQEQQVITALRQDLRVANGTLDLWIDSATSLIHRVELKGQIEASINPQGTTTQPGAQAMQPLIVASTFDGRVDLSNFNQQVSISLPTNAVQVQLPTLALK